MYHSKQHFPKSKRRVRTFRAPSRIKPGADSKLKKVFAGIGVPESRPFVPDAFQLEALAAVEHTDCLVSVPTGAGKTWIAEQAIARILEKGGRSWYACPLKALSNAKYADFSKLFGPSQVGILTGDRKENPDAPLIVGTTEILRNQLYDAMHRGRSLAADFVVLDEAHFLGDEDRGVVWEEIMIYLPSRIPLLLLSATIGNADQIAAWLSSIRSRPCIVVEETTRPVPLFALFFHPSGTLLPLTSPAARSRQSKIYPGVAKFLKTGRRRFVGRHPGAPPFGDVLRVLRKFDLLPAVFFLKSRADCDRALDFCRDNLLPAGPRQAHLSARIDEYVRQFPRLSDHRQRWQLEHLAVGAHHSGQLPAWKLLLERLMTAGLLDAVFATSTVAAGVNFPARTIVLLNSDRYNGKHFAPLTATEFHQMTGRAGRRGMDKIGFVLFMPGRHMDLRLMARLLSSPSLAVTSQIKINFSMVLNLLLSHDPDQIQLLLKKSFAAYCIAQSSAKKKAREPHKLLWQDFLRHLEFLKLTGFVTAADELNADGRWASQLRVDQPLLIAEGFRRAVFPSADPDLLAAIIACLVNEREVDVEPAKKAVPPALAEAFTTVSQGLKPLVRQMTRHGFEVRPLLLRPAAAMYAWAQGKSWEQVLNIAELEEGDLAMLVLRTADHLRHIRRLQEVFPEPARTAAAAIEKILKPPVIE